MQTNRIKIFAFLARLVRRTMYVAFIFIIIVAVAVADSSFRPGSGFQSVAGFGPYASFYLEIIINEIARRANHKQSENHDNTAKIVCCNNENVYHTVGEKLIFGG